MNIRKQFFVRILACCNYLTINVIIMSENSNEWIKWIEESISKNHFKYYEYEHFHGFQEVGSGGFGKVFRAKWKSSHTYLALKSFYNFNNNMVKEIVQEAGIIYIFSS
jgi:hypothetical protein